MLLTLLLQTANLQGPEMELKSRIVERIVQEKSIVQELIKGPVSSADELTEQLKKIASQEIQTFAEEKAILEKTKNKNNERIVDFGNKSVEELQRIHEYNLFLEEHGASANIMDSWTYTDERVRNMYASGWCTWYVGVMTDNFGLDVSLGNAGMWYRNAEKHGLDVGQEAKPASAVVFSGAGYNKLGHVGYVTDVLDEHIVIEDMHYKGRWIVTKRIVPKNDKRIKGYIYTNKILL